jgi:hypothetical protein
MTDPTPGSHPFLGLSWSWSPCRRTRTRLLVLTLSDAQVLRRGHPQRRPTTDYESADTSMTLATRRTLAYRGQAHGASSTGVSLRDACDLYACRGLKLKPVVDALVVAAARLAEFRSMGSRRRASAPRRAAVRPCRSCLARGRAARQSVAEERRRRSLGQESAACTDPPPRLVAGCSYLPLKVASEVARMGRRRSRPGRPGPGGALRLRPCGLYVYESLPAPEGTVPSPRRRNYLTSRSDE